MEDVIIGLLFVYFFVIRPLLKQVRKGDGKKQSSGQRSPLGTLMEKLREKVQEIAEEAAAVRREKAQRSPGNTWKELFAEDAPEPGMEPWETAASPPLQQGWPVGDPWTPETDGGNWETPPERPEPVRSAPEREPAAAPSAGVQPAPARRFSPAGIDLRQAVVWSEILGPPVSLRDGG